MSPTRPVPEGLADSGANLWRSMTGAFDFDPHEEAVLLEACRVADRLDVLAADVARDGTTVATPQGLKAHPSLPEARAQALTLARLIASLRLPAESGARTQARSTRGVYSITRGGNGGPRVAAPGPRVVNG